MKLPYFIAYALHRTKLHPSVTFASRVLFRRLKAQFPSAWGSSGHRLFVSAFMLASKVICDDTYSNKSWSIVAQGMFQLREINQMEREMYQYLEWELNVDLTTLEEFEEMVCKDRGHWLTPDLHPPVDKEVDAAVLCDPLPPHLPHQSLAHQRTTLYIRRRPSALCSLTPSYVSPPETPSPSYLTSSPASSASPSTPTNIKDLSAKIVLALSSPGYQKPLEHVQPPASKSKMLAFASPCV